MVAVSVEMLTDASSGEVETNETVNVTIQFRSAIVSSTRVTIDVTNGANILINNPSDITFLANGVVGGISDLQVSGSQVQFTANGLASTPLVNEVVFSVQAPSAPGSFNISTRIGAATPSPMNSTTQSFDVVSGFTVDSSHDTVVGSTAFTISGNAGVDNAGNFVAIAFRHIATGVFVDALEDIAFVGADGQFELSPRSFPASADEGMYEVVAVLLDGSFIPIAQATTVIEFVRSVNMITVAVSHDEVVGDAPFTITGTYSGDDAAIIAVAVFHSSDMANMIFEESIALTATSGNFTVGPFVLTDAHQEGTYIVIASLVDGSYVVLATAQTEFVHVRPVDTTPSGVVPDAVEIFFSPMPSRVSYFGESLFRINDNSTVRVTGVALDANRQRVPNATFTVGFLNPSWTGNISLRYIEEEVTTDANGDFSVTLRTGISTHRYNAVRGLFRDHFDRIRFRAYVGPRENPTILRQSTFELWLLGQSHLI